MKSIIQHSTFHTQRRRVARCVLIGCWALNVQCPTFPLAIMFLAAALPLQGQTNIMPALQPPYGELPATFWEQHGTSVVVAGLGMIALVAFGVRLFFRPKPKIIIPPEVQARQALTALRELPEDGAVLSRVSQTVRNYFIAAFQLSPGEYTTAEFGRTLAGCEKLDDALTTVATDFLRGCDARKFSTATALVPLNAADQALQLVALAEQRRAQLRKLAETQTQGRRA